MIWRGCLDNPVVLKRFRMNTCNLLKSLMSFYLLEPMIRIKSSLVPQRLLFPAKGGSVVASLSPQTTNTEALKKETSKLFF